MPEGTLPTRFTLSVDGTDYPIDIAQISARLVGEIEVGFLLEVGPLIGALIDKQVGVRQVAALCYLSERMQGRAPTPDQFLDGVTLASTAQISYEEAVAPADGVDADPEA
jgi:hypothetical protein